MPRRLDPRRIEDVVQALAERVEADGAVYLQDPDQVSSYRMVAGNLRQVALGPDQSIALIESMLVS